MGESNVTLRPLTINDLDQVVVLDRRITEISRRGFLEKRLKAQSRDPDAFVSVAAYAGNDLVGFALAYLLNGEFGSTATLAVLDAISVDPQHQSAGIGHQLMEAVCEQAQAKGAAEMQTQVSWEDTAMFSYFASTGFALAPRLVLERDTAGLDF
ncbi:MAG TPA: GNAT family N-acetyltransferase [Gammaproteobacteria bacterium]